MNNFKKLTLLAFLAAVFTQIMPCDKVKSFCSSFAQKQTCAGTCVKTEKTQILGEMRMAECKICSSAILCLSATALTGTLIVNPLLLSPITTIHHGYIGSCAAQSAYCFCEDAMNNCSHLKKLIKQSNNDLRYKKQDSEFHHSVPVQIRMESTLM